VGGRLFEPHFFDNIVMGVDLASTEPDRTVTIMLKKDFYGTERILQNAS
jgi:hypothetical protein